MSKNCRHPEDTGKSNVENNRLNRRRFVTWLTQGSLAATVALAVGQAIRFLSFQPPDAGSTVIPVGQPDDYPGIVAFLASDDAAYITGQTISVSGGLTMHG